MQGVKATAENPNPYLYQSLAVLAAEMGLVEESRKWFMKGTRTLVVCHSTTDSVILNRTLHLPLSPIY